MRVDVHQHLWSPPFVEALRARSEPPLLDGWTLVLDGEPDYEVSPQDHDVEQRSRLNRSDAVDLALVSLSSPLGIEFLADTEAAPLLDAYHKGALELPGGFGAWAAACVSEPDPAALAAVLDAGCVGLQLPATALADRAGYEHCGSLLHVLEARDQPLFIHPGPAAQRGDAPAWWAAVVDYVQQMHAAYFAFASYGRSAHPTLKVCFALMAGLAPMHRERVQARGGPDGSAHGGGDPRVWFETSTYGGVAIGAVEQGEGAGRIVLGSDRPYAAPAQLRDESAAAWAAAALLGSALRSG